MQLCCCYSIENMDSMMIGMTIMTTADSLSIMRDSVIVDAVELASNEESLYCLQGLCECYCCDWM